MIRRSEISPPLEGEGIMLVEDILEHLRAWKADTLGTIASLGAARQHVEERARQLESPAAAVEYIVFFVDLFSRVASDLDRIVDEGPLGVRRGAPCGCTSSRRGSRGRPRGGWSWTPRESSTSCHATHRTRRAG